MARASPAPREERAPDRRGLTSCKPHPDTRCGRRLAQPLLRLEPMDGRRGHDHRPAGDWRWRGTDAGLRADDHAARLGAQPAMPVWFACLPQQSHRERLAPPRRAGALRRAFRSLHQRAHPPDARVGIAALAVCYSALSGLWAGLFSVWRGVGRQWRRRQRVRL